MFLVALLLGILTHTATTTTVQSNICDSKPTAPVIVAPTNNTTTSQAQILVSGTAGANTSIVIDDNGQQVVSVTSDSSGAFGATTPLTDGQNQIVATASDLCGNSAYSNPITVIYTPPLTLPTPPSQPIGTTSTAITTIESNGASRPTTIPITTQVARSGNLVLSIPSPRRFATPYPSVLLSGQTNIPATITVADNGQRLAEFSSLSDLSFRALVPLTMGHNSITITASTSLQTASVTLDVTRFIPSRTPLPSLWSRRHTLLITLIVALLAAILSLLTLIMRNRRSV